MLANYTTNPISRVDKTRTCNITASQMQGANQLPYYSIFAESIVLETNAFYSTHYLAGKSTTSVVYSPLISPSKNMRRNEVPTPKHFTAQSVFKTVPSPTELLLHWQDVGELNPNLLIDSQAH